MPLILNECPRPTTRHRAGGDGSVTSSSTPRTPFATHLRTMPTYPHHSCKLEIRRFEPQHPDKVPPGPPYLRLRTRTRTPTVVRARPAAHGRTPCSWAFVTCPERTQPNPKLQHLYVHVHAQGLGPVLTQLFQTHNLVPFNHPSTWQVSKPHIRVPTEAHASAG